MKPTKHEEYYSSDSYCDSDSGNESESTKIKKAMEFLPPIIVLESPAPALKRQNEQSHYNETSKKKKFSKKNEDLLRKIRSMDLKSEKSIVERILDSNLSIKVKKSLIDEYDDKLDSSSERVKYNNYLEKVLKIPFGRYKDINCRNKDIPSFLIRVREKLDKAIAGHTETKTEIIDYVSSMLRNPNSKTNIIALQSPPGCGKCLAYDTPVLMFDGSVKKVQDIVVNDILMGDDSTPRNVKTLGKGVDIMYKVTHSTSRRTYTVNSEHILCLVDENDEIVEMEVGDYYKKSLRFKGYSNPLEFKKRNMYEDVSYDMGKLYANGVLRDIPDDIRLGSYEVRLKFLSGMVDKSGLYYGWDSVEIFMDNGTNTDDLFFIIDSLGFLRTDDIYNGKIRIAFKIRDENCLNNTELFSPYRCEEQIQVEKLDISTYYGFELDGNNRFVLGNCIVTHNTKFVRALGEALELPFHQISFGGMNDASILNGHDYTYIGSKPGKICDIVTKAGYMNSVVMLDEIDKIGDLDSPKTKEINGILTHLLDKEQNGEFFDHYLGTNIPLDLSKVLFIGSFNNEYSVDPIVLNRIKVIKIKESTLKEKIDIVKNFTIPEIVDNLNLGEYDIHMSDEVIKYIIINKTVHEPGMRNINKNINTLFCKINTQLFLETFSPEAVVKFTKDLVYENIVLDRDPAQRIVVTNALIDKFVPMRNKDTNMMYM